MDDRHGEAGPSTREAKRSIAGAKGTAHQSDMCLKILGIAGTGRQPLLIPTNHHCRNHRGCAIAFLKLRRWFH